VYNLQEHYFVDLNYATCCNVTGLASDCHVNSYSNYTEVCSRNIQCNYNANPFLKSNIPFVQKDYIDFYCLVNFTSDYNCVAEVYKDGVLLQSNPDVRPVDMYGVVSTFQGNTPIIRGWYRKGTLLPGEAFSIRMQCSERAGGNWT
jgi:hypothetical protein